MTTESGAEALRVALYLRVSSEQQAKQDTSIPAQRAELEAYAERRGWQVVAEYVDEAESAKTDERPEFQRMIGAAPARPRPFDVVLVYALDRFARNRYDAGHYKRMLRKAGISVASYTQQIDDSPEGQLLEGVIEGVDQYYSDRLAIVTLRGQKEISRRGFRAGGQAPFGYRHAKRVEGSVERSVLEPDPVLGPVLVEIFRQRAQGVNRRTIAAMLDQRSIPPPRRSIWHERTIDEIVRNDVYLGRLTFNRRRWKERRPIPNPESEWIVVEGAHPALVTEELYAAANAGRRQHKCAARHVYLLSGLLTCTACGSRALSQKSPSRHGEHGTLYYYVCRGAREHRCTAPSLRADVVERAVLATLERPMHGADLQRLWERLQATQIDPQVDALRRVVDDLGRRRGNLAKAMEAGAGDGLAPRYRELGEQLDLERRRLENLEAAPQSERPRSLEELAGRLGALATMLDAGDRETLRDALRAILAEVRCDFSARQLRMVVRIPSAAAKSRGTTSRKVVPLGYCGGRI